MKHTKPLTPRHSPLAALLWNLGLLYLCYFLCRGVYVWECWDLYAEGWSRLDLWQLLWGGLRFDTAAIAYTALPWVLMLLLPVSPKLYNRRVWQVTAKSLYVVINTVALWLNLADTVYSRYTGRRTTGSFFAEFAAEGNLGGIVGVEAARHWYLFLIGLALLAALIWLYRPAKGYSSRHALRQTALLVVYLPLAVIGLRGGVTQHRPLSLADANGYVNQAKEANIVLNTPFSVIRTLGKATFTDPGYFSPDELDTLYSPLHQAMPGDDKQAMPGDDIQAMLGDNKTSRNIVILILESFGQEYWGYYNQGASEGGRTGGYTPFLDSLATQSLAFRHAYANGRKSIDAMPSILSGIPMFVEPYILTRYANNQVGSLAGELAAQGYRTAFFHGAENHSMGFQAFARSIGFQDYYGLDEYCADPLTGGRDDYDGMWGIWDEEFMQYFARMADTLPQPFLATLFTVTSHHPFQIPDRYADRFQGGSLPIYRTIQYTDYALRRFFAAASQMPWYKNTLFVITADHTNYGEQEVYMTGIGKFRVPILIYDPSGTLPVGPFDATAQQTDIMPTLLGQIGAERSYLAFGQDLLHTPADSTWAVSYDNGVYQYVQGDWLLLFDGREATGLYRLYEDPLLHDNLVARPDNKPLVRRMSTRLKAIIQSYMTRMSGNRMTP